MAVRIFFLAAIWVTLLDPAQGQSISVISSTGSAESLIQGSKGFLYGTAAGGTAGHGEVFLLSTAGAITVLHNFGDGSVVNDGVNPSGPLLQATDGNYYGTTSSGGTAGNGTAYVMTPAGVVTILHNFGDSSVANDGLEPESGLIQGVDGNFYGTTGAGGTASDGTVFKMTPAGVVTILHNFGDGSITNDGKSPSTGLVQGADDILYGTTTSGGKSYGTIYRITTSGVMAILHQFNDGTITNDGQDPSTSLIQGPNGDFYGLTTLGGGYAGVGTFYQVTPQGVVTILHHFSDDGVANDGASPNSLSFSLKGFFYGTTQIGGAANAGTAFEITPQGATTILHSFGVGSVPNDGTVPSGAFVLASDGNFYGATTGNTLSGAGTTIFRLSPALPNLLSVFQIHGVVGKPFSYQTVATQSTFGYRATGIPPAGLTLNLTNGQISGTPLRAGTYTVNLDLTNAYGTSVFVLTFTINPAPAPAITSSPVAFGQVGQSFSYAIGANNSPATYAQTGLPTNFGLNLDAATGVISGVPTAAGTFAVSITATNAAGTSVVTNTISIQIFPTAPTLSQEYVVIHRFGDGSTPSDGANPMSLVQGFDGSFYGVTQSGGTGTYGEGTFFNMTAYGTVSLVNSFGSGSPFVGPLGLTVGADGNFYIYNGYVSFAVSNSLGDIAPLFFENGTINPFTNSSPFVQGADGDFYGCIITGEEYLGAILKTTPQGQFTFLHGFTYGNDGYGPHGKLVQGANGAFYGTNYAGGANSDGTIFKITPQGQYTVLHTFGDGTVTNDGTRPTSGLILGTDGNFYGTTPMGGLEGTGTIYKMTPAGQVTIIHSFGDGTVTHDGATPNAPLLQGLDGNFYGTTSVGGSVNEGVVFSMTPSGTISIIHSFGDGFVANDGATPGTLLQGTDGNIYGVTYSGGIANPQGGSNGIVFAIFANLKATQKPIYTGAASATAPLEGQLTFTPQAAFGLSGSGTEAGGSAIPQPADSGMTAALTSVLPLTIRGNFSETNWTLSGTLPNFLAFDSTSGTISGTPVQAGTFSLIMTPNNAIGSGTPEMVTLYIDVLPVLNSSAKVSGAVDTAFTYQITTASAPLAFGASELPTWLSVDPTTGLITGIPPAAGTYAFIVTASNVVGIATEPVVLTVGNNPTQAPVINSATSGSTLTGAAFQYQITATNTPTSYLAFPMPPGLLFSTTTGLISGSPTTAGVYSIPINATNSSGTFASVLNLTITQTGTPAITSYPATIFLTGQTNTFSITSTGNPAPALTESVTLPTGLSFVDNGDGTGTLSGSPASDGDYSLTFTANNDLGTPASQTFTLDVLTGIDFGTWASSYSLTDGATGTPENDGVPNLLKYFFDIAPSGLISATDRAALPTLGTLTASGTHYLTLTFRQSATETGIGVSLQTSTDLATWATVTPAIDQQIGTDPNTGDPIMEMGVIATGATQFIRLEVTSP